MRRNLRLRLSLGAVGVALLGVLLILGPLTPTGAGSSGARTETQGNWLHPATSSITASVTFQGTPVSTHTDSSNPITTSFGHNFVTVFSWNSPGQATLITQGKVSIVFLGATLATSSEQLQGAVPKESGSVTLNQTDFSQDQYLFEGVYELQASLFDNGQALWNTTFYVWVQAADHLTVINIVLVLIGILEIYQIAALGSARSARKQLGLETPPKQGGS